MTKVDGQKADTWSKDGIFWIGLPQNWRKRRQQISWHLTARAAHGHVVYAVQSEVKNGGYCSGNEGCAVNFLFYPLYLSRCP
jgi:hypothetical protein